MDLERDLNRAIEKVKRKADSPQGHAFAGGLVGGLLVSELANGDLLEALDVEVSDNGRRILNHLDRLASRLAKGALVSRRWTDTDGSVAAGAIGVGVATGWDDRPKKPLGRQRQTEFPKAHESGEKVTDRADRMYRIYKLEVPDDASPEEKYHRLGDILNELVVESSHEATVVQRAKAMTSGAYGPEQRGRAVGDWVQRNIVYVHDEDMPYASLHPELVEYEENGSLEVFQDARRTLEAGYGDCDCRVILVTSLLRSLGVYSFFRLISQAEPDLYSHIYSVVPLSSDQELALDTTPVMTPDGYVFHRIGWEPAYTGHMDIYPQLLPGQQATLPINE